MARSRTDEILEGWKMVAHSGRRPSEAPRPRFSRSGVSIGTLVAATVVIVLVVALSSRGSGQPPSLPGAGGEPSASASLVPPPSPSASAPSSPVASAPAGTPSPADIAAALAAIDQYTRDLVRGDYAAAWAMLGPEAQAQKGTLAGYSSERAAFFKNLGGKYTIGISPDLRITSWLSGTYGAPIDLAHAVLVEVDYPALAGNNAGYDLFIVNRGSSGLQIYDVR